MICPNCGAENPEDKSSCHVCGTAITLPPARLRSRRSKTIRIVTAVAVVIVLIVLGARLYLMTIEFGPRGVAPAISMIKTPATGGWQVNIVSITVTDIPWDDITVQLNDGSNSAEWRPRTTDLDGGFNVNAHYSSRSLGTLSVTLTVADTSGNGYVSGYDHFMVTAYPAFSSATTYMMVLIYEPTGDRMGAGVTFTG